LPDKRFEWRHLDKHTRDDDWAEISALDAWMAAKAAAETWDQEEHHMIRSGNLETFEIRDDAGVVTKWNVRGEAQPYYYANPTAQ
jgi:hypothetical protein